ncbi:ammonium transporter [Treponema sp.]|uniref:ammonium transporter n=1 Tax=Treponema sp. TaxID=166 RepID=UPI0025EA1C12|nr:ammonium transporter [Treponema sp.]MCR5218387.1 ammonium transporter [Treponema sp.]
MDVSELATQISSVSGDIWSVWFLAGAALVFWMQAGFAMVEAGFTRAKNTGNIIMKNLMDFCIGTVMWFIIGSSLMLSYTDPVTGEVSKGIWSVIGKPGFSVFSEYASFDFSGFVFNLVFCATTATIVSGAMAERTKFSTYCLYSAIISGIIYPVEAHWVWGGGFLAQMGFHDYAGSACIHMVGGICALIGAWLLGPRIGKFVKNKAGKVTKVNGFPGSNIAMGALGVFILWLGWYGFNGAAATDVPTLGSIFLTTTVAPAVATVTAMIFTWIKYGKPDVSMCLNASLAGLVAITAPCDVTDCAGAAIIGLVAGLLVIFGIWLLDHILHIDDPVGAVGVHMMNGIWGTIAVGLFATESAPGFALAGIKEGVFYGGGLSQLGLQLEGMGIIILWTVVTITIVFLLLKKTIGLRVTKEEEIIGLDKLEHGLASSYAGFAMTYSSEEIEEAKSAGLSLDESVSVVQVPETIPSSRADSLHKVVIITRQNKFEALKNAMNSIGVNGMTVINVMGCGMQHGASEYYRGAPVSMTLLPKIKVEIVVSKVPVDLVVETAKKALYTGHIGDGKIFVYPVDDVVKVRTGESGYDALQDED